MVMYRENLFFVWRCDKSISLNYLPTVHQPNNFNYVIIVLLKPLLLILRSNHGSICCPSEQKQLFLLPCKISARVLQSKIMNASTAACHRGGWDNTELMCITDPYLLGNMYAWISDSPVGSLETSVILFILFVGNGRDS